MLAQWLVSQGKYIKVLAQWLVSQGKYIKVLAMAWWLSVREGI